VVPLVRFTGQRSKMGEFANSRSLSVLSWVTAAVIIALNGWLLIGFARSWIG
jgi:manganese transport protein